MSTASDRPQGARSTASSPELPGSRNQTLTRVKSSEPASSAPALDGDIAETLGSAAEALGGSAPLDGTEALEAPPPLASGIHGDNLRKPYSSLAPQRRESNDAAAPTTSTPVPGRGPSGATRGSTGPSRSQTPARRAGDTQDPRRRATTCSKHGLARSRTGECMLCKKEQDAQKAAASGVTWPIRIALALLVGAAGFAAWLYLF